MFSQNVGCCNMFSMHVRRSTAKKKHFMAPFYEWSSTASRLEPLQGGSLLFTTNFPETPGARFINLGRMKN